MIKSILAAIDGSPASVTGLKEAVRWARLLDAELRGFYVEDEQRFVTYPAGISAEGGVPIAVPLPEDELRAEEERAHNEGDEVEQAFRQATAELKQTHGFRRERGNINDVLTREGRAVDLIVVGRRGRHEPASSHRPGPTTETLIHNALRPVLVVPEEVSGGDVVLMAYDGSRGVHRVLPPGTEMARAMGGKLQAVSFGDDPRQGERMAEILQRYWAPHGVDGHFQYIKREGRAAALIVEEARKRDAGLIVMGAFGHNPLRELIFGSTTLDVMEHTPCPVLLMA